MNILPAERPNPTLDRIANTIAAALKYSPDLYQRVAALILGPELAARDQAWAAEMNLMGSTILQFAAEKEAAETEARTLELRVEELRGGDDMLNAVRAMFLQRQQRVDLRYADCRDELRRTKQLLDEAAKERTGAARYIVQLEDRIRLLEEAAAA